MIDEFPEDDFQSNISLEELEVEDDNYSFDEQLIVKDRKTIVIQKALNCVRFVLHHKFDICASITIVLLIISLTFCLFLMPKYTHQYVMNTIEYQITELGDMSLWSDRDAVVRGWMDTVVNNSKYIREEDVEIFVRHEYTLEVGDCGGNNWIRVRDRLSGDGVGMSTLDIKKSSKFHSKACNYPYYPALEYIDQSTQKCERDQHECDHKFSRQGRIFFDSLQVYDTCEDVFKYFPYAGSEKSKAKNPVSIHTKRPWWNYIVNGVVGTSTYEIAFNLEYETLEGATDGSVPPVNGEWSIRITSKDYGMSDEWDQDFKKDVDSFYEIIKDKYSAKKCLF